MLFEPACGSLPITLHQFCRLQLLNPFLELAPFALAARSLNDITLVQKSSISRRRPGEIT
jgi:hypothetical protein